MAVSGQHGVTDHITWQEEKEPQIPALGVRGHNHPLHPQDSSTHIHRRVMASTSTTTRLANHSRAVAQKA